MFFDTGNQNAWFGRYQNFDYQHRWWCVWLPAYWTWRVARASFSREPLRRILQEIQWVNGLEWYLKYIKMYGYIGYIIGLRFKFPLDPGLQPLLLGFLVGSISDLDYMKNYLSRWVIYQLLWCLVASCLPQCCGYSATGYPIKTRPWISDESRKECDCWSSKLWFFFAFPCLLLPLYGCLKPPWMRGRRAPEKMKQYVQDVKKVILFRFSGWIDQNFA